MRTHKVIEEEEKILDKRTKKTNAENAREREKTGCTVSSPQFKTSCVIQRKASRYEVKIVMKIVSCHHCNRVDLPVIVVRKSRTPITRLTTTGM